MRTLGRSRKDISGIQPRFPSSKPSIHSLNGRISTVAAVPASHLASLFAEIDGITASAVVVRPPIRENTTDPAAHKWAVPRPAPWALSRCRAGVCAAALAVG
jgi:hypothetical protein